MKLKPSVAIVYALTGIFTLARSYLQAATCISTEDLPRAWEFAPFNDLYPLCSNFPSIPEDLAMGFGMAKIGEHIVEADYLGLVKDIGAAAIVRYFDGNMESTLAGVGLMNACLFAYKSYQQNSNINERASADNQVRVRNRI